MPVPVPGMKIGLANIIVLLAMYFINDKAALGISIIRVLMASLLFSGFLGFLYSVSGALISFLIMAVAKKIKALSIIGVSVLGGISHNVAQICVAILVMGTPGLTYYLPFLIVGGAVTGIAIGFVAKYTLKFIKKTGIKY